MAAAVQKGRGWDGVGSRTLRFVLDYTPRSLDAYVQDYIGLTPTKLSRSLPALSPRSQSRVKPGDCL